MPFLCHPNGKGREGREEVLLPLHACEKRGGGVVLVTLFSLFHLERKKKKEKEWSEIRHLSSFEGAIKERERTKRRVPFQHIHI